MDRMRGLGLFLGAVLLLAAPAAHAFSMAETMAVTGVQNSLAQNGMSTSPARTLSGVRGKLDAAVATKNAQLGGAGWGPGGGGGSGWSTAASGGGKGWSAASAGGGWSTGGGWTVAGAAANGWASGTWQ